MAWPDRYIVAPAFDSADAHFRADEPLGGGRVQLAAHNARLTARRNSVRPLCQHPGWRDFWRGAVEPALAPPTALTGPVVGDIDWSLGPKSGGVTFSSGPHYAWQYPDGRWPTARFTWHWKVDGGHTAGAIVAVTPAGRSVLSSAVAPNAATTTSASWALETRDVLLSLALVTPVLHEPVPGTSTDPPLERVQLFEFNVYLGAYCSSNSDTSGDRASLVGLSIFLVPP